MIGKKQIIMENIKQDEAMVIYIDLYKTFKSFILSDKFSWDKYKEVYQKTREKQEAALDDRYNFSDELNGIFDYRFEINGQKYSLDINDDIEVFGYCDNSNETGIDYSNAVFCNIYSHKKSYTVADATQSMIFAYDKKNNRCIEVLEINKNSHRIRNGRVNELFKTSSSTKFLNKVLTKSRID